MSTRSTQTISRGAAIRLIEAALHHEKMDDESLAWMAMAVADLVDLERYNFRIVPADGEDDDAWTADRLDGDR